MTWSRTDKMFFLSLIPSALTLVGLVIIFLLKVFDRSIESLIVYGMELFKTSTWNPELEIYGILSPLVTTFITSSLATGFAILFSVPLSIFISEYLKKRVKIVVSSLVEMMAGAPTVVYAIWALDYLAPFMRDYVLNPLHQNLGFIPIFSCKPITGLSILTASIALGISLIPYITSIITASYELVPLMYREACLGIGATKSETIITILSISKPAILASALLGLARASGETTITTVLIGSAFTLGMCIIGPGYTVPALIATQYANANLYRYAESVLYVAALVVLVVTLFLSFIGVWMLDEWRRKIIL